MASTLRLLGPPIVQKLYGASSGVIDLGGDVKPWRIVPQADLESNDTHKVRLLPSKASSSVIGTAFADALTGQAFANQPAGDGVEVVSDTVGDTARTLTIYGTTNGTGYVVAETITVNGTTQVSTTKTDWGTILGFEASAAHATATLTIREASGNATIGTLAATATQEGVADVAAASQTGYGLPVKAVGSGATTKIVGYVGTNPVGTTVYGSITLNGATAVIGNTGCVTVTKLLYGDVESSRTVTFSIGNLNIGAHAATVSDLGADNDGDGLVTSGMRYLHWCLHNGTSAATGGEYDMLVIKLYG